MTSTDLRIPVDLTKRTAPPSDTLGERLARARTAERTVRATLDAERASLAAYLADRQPPTHRLGARPGVEVHAVLLAGPQRKTHPDIPALREPARPSLLARLLGGAR